MSAQRRVLYCHCAYAKVVPPKVKAEVLERLGETQRDFDAVPDLCEMAARKDPALDSYAEDADLDIIACYPRAVRWLFHGAGCKVADETRILNMRTDDADAVLAALDAARTNGAES